MNIITHEHILTKNSKNYRLRVSTNNDLPVSKEKILITSSSLDSWDAISLSPFNLWSQKFLEQGYAVATSMIPMHGYRREQLEGLEGISLACSQGRDVFMEYTEELVAITDWLIMSGYSKIYSAGGSRTGYFAARHFAVDKRLEAVALLLPVVDWSYLFEFASMKGDPRLMKESLLNYASDFAGRNLLITLATYDSRVGSHKILELITAISRINHEKGYETGLEVEIVNVSEHSLSDHYWNYAGDYLLNINSKA